MTTIPTPSATKATATPKADRLLKEMRLLVTTAASNENNGSPNTHIANISSFSGDGAAITVSLRCCTDPHAWHVPQPKFKVELPRR